MYQGQENGFPRYQTIGLAADGECIHAGVHHVGRVTRKAVRKLERKWMTWRQQYLREHPGGYPLSKTALTPVVTVVIYPIDDPSTAKRFTV